MSKELFRIVGTQDADEGGSPIGIADVDRRAIMVGTIRKVKNVSAAYTVVEEDTGSLITVDTAATITLPAAAANLVGIHVEIAVIADVTVVVAATNAGELVTFNDAAANSFTWSTSSEKIGASCRATCISATKWLIQLMTEETQTTTVTT